MSTQPFELSPAEDSSRSSLDTIMLVIVAATLAGTCLLISATVGTEAGQVPWRPNSVLRVIAELMSLNYQYPTARGVEIKWLIQGLGAGAALAAMSIAWFIATRREESLDELTAPAGESKTRGWADMDLSSAAQVTLILLGCWSMLSALWAPWPQVAQGEGCRQLIFILWAIALGRTFNRKSACTAVEILFVVLVVMAAIGVWYYFERNPSQRLKFPIGNPIFLAACLLPGITLAPAIAFFTPRFTWWRVGGGLVGLVILLWAFALTGSRGPALGLAVGVLFAFCLLLPVQRRRLAILGLVILALSVWKLHVWPVTWIASRPETVRFRMYAWKYALDLFLSRPDIGRGQGSYALLAQAMSQPDAEMDPSAFPGQILGHAHCEWLEMLAELGAIGIGLMATGIGITLWAGLVAWRREKTVTDVSTKPRWYLLGLIIALLALLVEAATDVGLRLPGLPVIFYTVLGLLWAISKEPASEKPTQSGPIRCVGLCGGLLGAALIVSVATQDWMGALAEPQVAEHAKRHRWEEALNEAEYVGQHRLAVEGYLAGLYQTVRVAHDAAGGQLELLRATVSRVGQAQHDPGHIRELAKEDAQNFHRYFSICVQKGQTFLQLMPGYPNIASDVADVWLDREELQSLLAKLGEPVGTKDNTSNLAQAREWLAIEYTRDRMDADNAMRLLQLIPDRPLIERLNLLRVPLRRGPMHPQFEPALAELMQQPDFKAVMNQWLTQATEAIAAREPGRWPDPYAPESLRLAAVARKMRGEFEQAAASAQQAVRLYESVRQNLLGLVFYARQEQAKYLLLANPDKPEAAIEAARAGLAEFSGYSNREHLTEAKRQYSLYLLAGGKEVEARQVIREIGGKAISEESIERNIGYGLAELCQTFVNFPPRQRPQRFDNWIAQSLKLTPNWPATRMVAAHVALENGQDEPAVEHLQALSKLVEDPKQFISILQALVTQYRDRPALQRFAAPYLNEQGASTRPTTTREGPP